MKLEKVKIDDLISPEYNPRQISSVELEKLKTSLNEFGYISPIIVNEYNNHIVGGNQRCLALKQLGYTMIDVIYINEPDINKEKALNIRLNNLSGEWDKNKLQNILDDLKLQEFDVSLTGFDIEVQKFEFDDDPLIYDTPTSDIVDMRGGDQEETVDESYFEIPDDEPEYDESIADTVESITCPRCGYELPKN
jgi:hypothetical protein